MPAKKKQNIKISDKDKKDWFNFITNTETVEDKDQKNISPLNKKNRIFDLKVDLHGLKLNEAEKKVADTISLALNKKYRKILIITGKGIHSNYQADPYVSKDLRLLKHAIPEFIQNQYSEKIVSITTAPQDLGGEGAIIVFFKK